ncbi:ribonuclease R [Allochromatium warmingii]|uniref:Ribonuclease R n=1 Tax=Allochromatium warmingii TaxID=61595 RepID=A0A1H3JPH4_ALLWA|nr:ribonuclease R [Allochromatium warmingii]
MQWLKLSRAPSGDAHISETTRPCQGYTNNFLRHDPALVTKRRSTPPAQNTDPHRQREARKYANPIPSREFILETLAHHGAPLAFDELVTTLGLVDEPDLIALERRLGAMIRDGQLVRNRNQAFCPVNSRDLIAGRVIGHPDGFGFVRPDEGGDDLYLYPKEMRALFHGDRVVVRVAGRDRRGRLEAAVVEILERNTRSVVGRLYKESGVGFVVPDHKRLTHDIIIPSDRLAGAEQGQIVVADITDQPTQRTQPIGRIREVLGDHLAPGMETDIAIRAHNLPVEWPAEVLAEIAGLTAEVPEAAKAGRVDLRQLPLVTIDGADARDFDDAVYCERKPKGWKLLVCIADVSSYVRPGTALDREAHARGNSVYFPDRVIPMLPEVLSNGLCSLNPHVDRLCMAAELYVNREGQVTRTRFFEAVMRSQARLTYDQVAAMVVEGDGELCERFADILPHLHELYQLYQALQAARATRGAIDFDTTETKFLFNQQGRIESVVPLVRNDAHKLIEECMLAANVAAARQFQRKRLPGIYRIHDLPRQEKLNDLREFLAQLALKLPGGEQPTAADYAQLLEQIKERPDRRLIQTVLLRSMQQAMYSAENAGHFGLAFEAYTHFTSPIRRYPDLVVHRLIKHLLAGGTAADLDYTKTELQQAAEWCSGTERRADEATRDAEDWLKCEFMQDKLGEKFDGTITSVNSFGIFVELDAVHVDGLVHITALDNDFYHFDPIGHRLQGERTGTVYRLGDRLRVQVAAVNLDERKIDFVLVGPTAKSARRVPKPTEAPLTDAKAKVKPKSKQRAATATNPSSGKPTPSAAKKARTRANKRKRSASNPVNRDD